MTDTILNLDDLSIPFANRGTATVIDGDISLPTDFATAYSGMIGASNLNGQTLTISGLTQDDTIGLTGSYSIVANYVEQGPTPIAQVSQTSTSVSFTFFGTNSASFDAFFQSLTFRTTDDRAFSTRDLTFSLNTPTFPQTGTVKITIGEEPPVIGSFDDVTIPFEARFVRNVIDSDITLPTSFTNLFDETTTLNGRTLTITGTQFGDAIRFAAGSGFVLGYPNTTLNGQPIAATSGNAFSTTFTFTTAITTAQLEQMLQAMTFQAGPNNPAETSRTLNFSLDTPTPLTGSVDITLSAPEERNLIGDLDNQTVSPSGGAVALDTALLLSVDFVEAYSTPGSLNNLTMAITGWTGQQIPLGTVEGSGVSILADAGSSSNVYVDGTQIGVLQGSSGTFYFNTAATPALVERMLEGVTIQPQLNSAGTQTITITITTPIAPQFGTVTFTQAPVSLSDLRETVDVSYSSVNNEGLLLDSNVTLTGEGPWEGGKIEVTGLGEGDSLMFIPASGSGLYISDEGVILGTRGGGFEPEWFTEIAALPTTGGSTYTITLGGISTQEVETIIESLRLVEATSGARTLTISVSDSSGFVASDTVTVNVGYIPTLTDMVDTLDLTAAEAAAGQLLDADVSFRVDSDLEYGGVVVTGVGKGEEIILRTDGGSPFVLEGSTILIDGREVGTLYTFESGPQIAFTVETTAKDVEAMIENLLFRATAPSTVASRDITITISDTDGETDTQVVTVNLLPAGSKEMSYQILGWVNETWVPVDGASGITGDLDPTDLFTDDVPDEFVVNYSGLLNVGPVNFGERTVIAFNGVNDLLILEVNGQTYEVEGPEGRLILDLPPGLHKITASVYYSPFGGEIEFPSISVGTAIPPQPGDQWPPYDQTPLFDNVRTVPETLYRVAVTTTATNTATGGITVLEHVFYVTSQDDIPGQLDALRQSLNLPPFLSVEQDYSVMAEVSGSSGADTLTGTDGADLLDGGAGDDLLLGSLGADTMDGGSGVNTVSYEASNARVTVDLSKGIGQGGHAEGDVLRNINVVLGSRFGDHLIGSAGDDSLYGMAGADTLIGNAGDDLLDGGDGADSLRGGEGNDLLRGGFSADTLMGDAGNDVLRGGFGNDRLEGGDGQDSLGGGTGNDTLLGGDGNDMLRGGQGADSMDGGAGQNRTTYDDSDTAVNVNLATGVNTGGHAEGDILLNIQEVTGSRFGDALTGGALADIFYGGAGADTIDGGRGADRLFGGAGDDLLTGGDGNDFLMGGLGADTIDGGRGVDTLSYAAAKSGVVVHLGVGAGDGGNRSESGGDRISNVERVIGSAFADSLTGGDGAETLIGGAGDDVLFSSAGNDVLTGGAGGDIFVFNANFGSDRISDFGDEDGLAIVPDLWGDAQFGNVGQLLDAYGYQGDGYVELRLTASDILRIDNVTLDFLRENQDVFILGA
ncbi:MAG: calcium-binding protein [Paracoccaceae bacterium]